jgi:nucleolar GTP-binding protein
MLLQNLGKIENAEFYLRIAFKAARDDASRHRKQVKVKDRLTRTARMERRRMLMTERALCRSLLRVITNFPRFEELPEFYLELAKATLPYQDVKQALRRLYTLCREVGGLRRKYDDRAKTCNDPAYLRQSVKAFDGRLRALVRRHQQQLALLDEARRTIRDYPTVKTSMPTVVITGFPNVGKTTLLSRLTSASPEIREYPFTTKGLNVGYARVGRHKVQLLDTPGTLNRPDKMNDIERQAHIATRVLADCVIYVFDLTEPYPLEEQRRLFSRAKGYGKPMIVYASKTDLVDDLSAISEYQPVTGVQKLRKTLSVLAEQFMQKHEEWKDF